MADGSPTTDSEMPNGADGVPPKANDSDTAIRQAIFLIAILVLALTNLPYLWGRMVSLEGLVFSGFLYTYSFGDIFSYLAKMRQGMEGSWLYRNPFSTEPFGPIPLFVFYLALGHGAKITGLSLIATYHVARVGIGFFLMFAVNRMLRVFAFGGPARVLAFLFAFTAGGFGWIARWSGANPVPIEFQQTELFSFQSMVSYPHFILSLAIMVWVLTDFYLFAQKRSRAAALIRIAALLFVLAWAHPRPILTILSVGGVAAVWGAFLKTWSIRPWIVSLGVAAAAGAGPMIATLMWVRADPLWASWAETDTLSSPPLQYLGALGLLWPLALWGAALAVRRQRPWAPVLVGWAVVGSILPFLPIAAQVRLAIGWSIPLSILAGYGLGEGVWPWVQTQEPLRRRSAIAAVTALCLVMSFSSLSYLHEGVWRITTASWPGYYAQERADAMDWLASNTQNEDVVLSSDRTGIYLPAITGNRVVLGHWAETLHHDEVTKEFEKFLKGETPDADRAEFLEKHDVRYLFFGQWEKMAGDYDPAEHARAWKPVWTGGATTIYESIRRDK